MPPPNPQRKTAKTRKPPDADAFSFEHGMEQVEEIIARIESGDIGLQESIDAFEKASAILTRCERVLEHAKQRVIELGGTGEGDTKKGRTAAG